MYSYRLAVLKTTLRGSNSLGMHIVVGLYILKDDDFSETTVLKQSLECSLSSLRDQRLSGSNTLKRLFFDGFPAFWNDYSFYLTVPEIVLSNGF